MCVYVYTYIFIYYFPPLPFKRKKEHTSHTSHTSIPPFPSLLPLVSPRFSPFFPVFPRFLPFLLSFHPLPAFFHPSSISPPSLLHPFPALLRYRMCQRRRMRLPLPLFLLDLSVLSSSLRSFLSAPSSPRPVPSPASRFPGSPPVPLRFPSLFSPLSFRFPSVLLLSSPFIPFHPLSSPLVPPHPPYAPFPLRPIHHSMHFYTPSMYFSPSICASISIFPPHLRLISRKVFYTCFPKIDVQKHSFNPC